MSEKKQEPQSVCDEMIVSNIGFPGLDEHSLPSGRLTADDIDTLCRYSAGRELAVDIGTFQGLSASLMSRHAKQVITIDTFWGQSGYPDYDYDKVKERLTALGNVQVYKGAAESLSDVVPDHAADLFFIDDGHGYDNVINQLNAFRPKARPGALFLFHDYTRLYPEVVRAVDEWITAGKLIPIERTHFIMVTRRAFDE